MSQPSSWYLPFALAGVRLDRLRGTLDLAPSWPSSWADELSMPVFLPGLEARVTARRGAEASAELRIVRLTGAPIDLREVRVRLPGAHPIGAPRRPDVVGGPGAGGPRGGRDGPHPRWAPPGGAR